MLPQKTVNEPDVCRNVVQQNSNERVPTGSANFEKRHTLDHRTRWHIGAAPVQNGYRHCVYAATVVSPPEAKGNKNACCCFYSAGFANLGKSIKHPENSLSQYRHKNAETQTEKRT